MALLHKLLMARPLTCCGWALAVVLSLGACTPAPDVPLESAAERTPAGAATAPAQPFPSFDVPLPNLPESARMNFFAGKALAEQPWVKAPTATTARDGLGPLYNARTCMFCHVRGGRGRIPEQGDELLIQGILRLSLDHGKYDQSMGVIPHPAYGDQLQTQSISLAHQLRHLASSSLEHSVAPEAYIYVDWQEETFRYPDGETAQLRQPRARIDKLRYGSLDNARTSLRNAPPMLGVGLLEAVPEASILAREDPQDNDKDGISGRANRVWDPQTNSMQLGRFGWKANRADLPVTVAAAFVNDVGITNPIFSDQPCTAQQTACLAAPSGNDENGHELPQSLLDLVVLFSRNLAVPARRAPQDADVLRGRTQFYQTGCQGCHQPDYVTGSGIADHLANQHIWPYTDLLLHDMGENLADQRSDFSASGREWRTPPLWGVGVSALVNGSGQLLHDGRARSVEEAILWHGGEAAAVRETFINLPQLQRQALIKFVESL
ncbi:putative lipoprotein [Teredinibacter turnerae T7901]|uniref:Lipoprotein n=2 Tax=Teredinibacter turnerae TaxID=2426 RepID=C5BPL3_TERTT|nr:putative lipoprotein [Teredinibacter turnerae T7901]